MNQQTDKFYTIQQLLDDAYFISSVKNPTLESDMYWKDAIKKGYLTHETYWKARSFILSVQPDGLEREQKAIMWEKIQERNRTKQLKKIRLVFITTSVAACLIAILILSIGHLTLTHDSNEDILALIEKPDFTAENIQLILSDEKPLSIKYKNANIHYTDKGEILVNSDKLEEENIIPDKSDKKEVTRYNQLIIPKGQQSSLILSDGTKIWINAGTRLIYPPVFNQNERIIHVEGEIYLDVSFDKERPFIVKTKEFDIQVLGTSFNVNSYDDREEQSVVLLEGAVKVKTRERKEEISLAPDQMLSWSGGNYHIETVNAADYAVWKNGFYQYRRERISNVIQKLAYYYNKPIFCDQEIAGITCSGKLFLKQDLENVLETLCKGAVPMTFYKEEGNYYIRLSE